VIISTDESFFKYSQSAFMSNQYTSVIDFTSSSIIHGVDWLFSYVETIAAYDYKILYFWFYNSIYDDSYDFFFISCWYSTLLFDTFQLFWSVILDSYVVSELICNHYDEHWYQTMLASRDISLLSIHHPEFALISAQCSESYISKYMSSFNLAIRELIETERLLSPISNIIDFVFLVFISTMFISIYFSYFTTSVKEEVTIDYDYMSASGTVEAEKEITGFDDMLMGIIIVLYLVGWYFYVHCWTVISNLPELMLLFYLLPGLFFLIIFIPVNLIYDFGGLFLAYLRGVGATPLILYELMFDYIAFLIFGVRILVQGVRIILMIFTYASMHDLVMLMYCGNFTFLAYENFWDEFAAVSFNIKSVSWYLVSTLPARIMYWIYEVLHTFFVLTGQCVAFFAIVFWLYLFLYTFFVIEKQEDYFFYKRIEFRKYYSDLNSLKNKSITN
jgi:hypothetical protein